MTPVFKKDLLAGGNPAVRTASISFQAISYVYAPFGYAEPVCPAGTTQQYKIYAELVDNITS